MRIILVLLFLSVVPLLAADVVELTVVSGGAKPAIAFVPFTNKSGKTIPEEYRPERIIASDLELSSRFRAVQSFEMDSAYWEAENVIAYVTGVYSKNSEGQWVIECRLTDYVTNDLLFGRSYTLDEEDIRKNMHHFSDNVVKVYYKKQGVASTKLAYVTKNNGKKEIVVSDYDGYNKKLVTSDGTINTMPYWSADNSSLYFVSFKSGQGKIYKKNIYTGKVSQVVPGVAQSFVPRESPGGTELLYTGSHEGNSEIYRFDLETKKIVQLTDHWAIETSGAWSPDGKQIVFSSDRGGAPQLYTTNKDGTELKRLTFEGRYNDAPNWSPLGDKIVFCGMSKTGQFDIYTIDIATKQVDQLTSNQGNNESPVWSPDGKLIVFSSTRSGSSHIYIMAVDGSMVKQITFKGENTSPSWSNNITTKTEE